MSRSGPLLLRATAAALVAAVAIQFVPVSRTNPPTRTAIEAPRDVRAILERSCFDCHSNRTRWPWYSRVAPVSWLVARDVARGRREVDFSDWPAFDFDEQDHLLSDIAKAVEKRGMPLPLYLAMHPEARLSEAERRRLVAWARGE